MLIVPSMRLLITALPILTCSTARASTCSNGTFNATGSLTESGPRINDTYPASQWTLSNLISESPNPDAPHVSVVRHTFELQTSPFQNFSDSEFPFAGCLIFVPTFVRSWANGIHDDGTCSSVLDPDCLAELITNINATAAKISGTSNATDPESCSSLQTVMSNMDNIDSTSKCSSHWSSPIFTFLSDPGSAYLPNSDPACSMVDVNANSTAIFKNGWTSFGQAEGDYLGYDAALRVPTPMIVAVWSKPGITIGWADTKVMCVPGNQTIAAGSRDVDAAVASTTTSSSATSTSSSATSSQTSGGASTFSTEGYFAFIIVLVVGLTM
ncbi:hypothetical protein EG329_004560 [Mollisiaceae sp. DMI_Dod_QoI]|nr:hypothetical protein EG329_004560 [Helotiales sp. DMI_Dod_QoI]